MKKNISILFLILAELFTVSAHRNADLIYKVNYGKVEFTSKASLETITGVSEKLNGLLNTNSQEFAFKLVTKSFVGFNGLLQREHFNESYLESEKYPESSFTGKIIETVSFNQPGSYAVRAKGMLYIHGVEMERIIKCVLIVEPGIIKLNANFLVNLSDHKITIPRIVFDKISPEINIVIDATLIEKKG